MAVIIRASGALDELTLVAASGPLLLAQLHDIVGGYIEIVPLAHRANVVEVLIANDDGHRLGLPPNAAATTLVQQVRPGDVIVGDCVRAVITHGGTARERWT